MHTRLLATSTTLAHVLKSDFISDVADLGSFFGGGAGSGDVYLSTPQELGTKSGLSLWLYRLSRDENRLNVPRGCGPCPQGASKYCHRRCLCDCIT